MNVPELIFWRKRNKKKIRTCWQISVAPKQDEKQWRVQQERAVLWGLG